MNKKAFTLAELMGVIILLGLIMIIAFPTILKQIKKSASTLDKATENLIIASASNYLDENKNNFPNNNGNTYCIELQTLVDDGKLSYDIKDSDGESLSLNKFVQVKVENKQYIYSIVDTCESSRYQEPILRGADPELGNGMIAVTISDNGTVNKADVTKEWYNYSEKKWANVVTVTESTREQYMNADAGTIIAESDILTYLVWIPRYKYKLWNVSNMADTGMDVSQKREISIIFESKNDTKSLGNANGTYLTHPAFTFGSEELNGFWVGKFESSKSGSSADNSVAGNEVRIKPNVSAWVNIQAANAFYTTTGMNESNNVFGLSELSDSHMMKNTEWGAVAYLSHSKYGINNEVRINNQVSYKTGCGASVENSATSSTCQIEYGKASSYPQSTTGNISGIFDMSGGAWEYVMGIMLDSTNTSPVSGVNNLYNSGFNGKLTCPTCNESDGNDTSITEITDGKPWPETKYYDTYKYNASSKYWDRRILGDATGEMGPFNISGNYSGSWYNDYAAFLYKNAPWFVRGGGNSRNVYAGIFFFGGVDGDARDFRSFRVVVLDK